MEPSLSHKNISDHSTDDLTINGQTNAPNLNVVKNLRQSQENIVIENEYKPLQLYTY